MNSATHGCSPDRPDGLAAIEPIERLCESHFKILWWRRGTVLVASLCALVGGILYLQLATPLYTSTARICVEQTGPQVFERDNSGVITRWNNYLYTQAERLQSTEILSAALKAPDMANQRTLARVDDPIAAIRHKLDVVVGKKDEIINISFRSPYPDEAARIVNTIVDAYITDRNQRKRSTIAEVVRILKEEKGKRSQELFSKLQKMTEFKQENENLAFETAQHTNVILQRMEYFSSVLTEARIATMESKSFYEATKKLADEPARLRQLIEAESARGASVTTAGEACALRVELNRMERDRADLLRELEPNHPAITAVNVKMERIQTQIAELEEEFAQGQLAVAERQYLTARDKEEELQKSFDEQRQQAILLSNQLTQYTLLEADYEQAKKLCDLLDDSIQRLDVTTEVRTLNISVLETAAPALLPSAPHKAKTMGLALCLGLLAGAGLALVREWRDQRLRSTQEISVLLNLPVLGVIPAVGRTKQTPAARGQEVRTAPDSHEAEAFRTLRTAVFFGSPKEETRTILVTSPASGEGKSTVTSNLGIAMAQTGHRVLILDADLRRPMQHNIFELDRQAKGLSTVLTGEMNMEDAIEHTSVENLDVLTCGPNVPNPAEMLHSENFSRILEKLASQYDRILVDSPPVIAVTDGLILAALCDVTILVLQAEVSTRRISMQGREALAGVDARVLGVVINNVSRGGDRYGYCSDYGYYHCYGHNGNGRQKARRVRTQESASVWTRPLRSVNAIAGEQSSDEAIRR